MKTSRDSLNNIITSFNEQIDVLETVAAIYTKAENKALNNYSQVVERGNTISAAQQGQRFTRRATFNPNLVVEGWLSQLVYEDMLKENTEGDKILVGRISISIISKEGGYNEQEKNVGYCNYMLLNYRVTYAYHSKNIDNNPKNPQEILALANNYLDNGEYSNALKQFEAYIHQAPLETEGYIGAAHSYLGLREKENAERILSLGYLRTEDSRLQDTEQIILDFLQNNQGEESK